MQYNCSSQISETAAALPTQTAASNQHSHGRTEMATPDSTPIKTCTKCGKDFPATLEHFYKEKGGKYGVAARCKKCHNAITTPNARAWKAANPERAKQHQKTYDEKHSEQNRDRQKRWQQEQPDQYRESNRNARRKWRKNNPEANLALEQRHRAKKRSLPATLTEQEWRQSLAYFDHHCAYCGQAFDDAHPLTVDHFIPLSSPECPGSVIGNVLPACQSCNTSKGNSKPREWLIRKFGFDNTGRILARIQAYFASVLAREA